MNRVIINGNGENVMYEDPAPVLANTYLNSRNITRNNLEFIGVGSYAIKNLDGGFYGFNSRKNYDIYTPENPTIKEFRMCPLANPDNNEIPQPIHPPRQPPQRRNILYFDDIEQIEPQIYINQIIQVEPHIPVIDEPINQIIQIEPHIPIIDEHIPIIDEIPLNDEPIPIYEIPLNDEPIPKSSIINNVYNYIKNIWKNKFTKKN